MAYQRQPRIIYPSGNIPTEPGTWRSLRSQGMGGAYEEVLPQLPNINQIPSQGFMQAGQSVIPAGTATNRIPRPPGAPGGYSDYMRQTSQSMPSVSTPAAVPNQPAPTYQQPRLTPFMRTFLSNVQTMDEQQRSEYFDTLSAAIKDKMDRWSFRIARGIPLSADQQTQYLSLRNAFNDIQSYLSNQTNYDEFLRRMGGVSPVAQAGQAY